MTLLAILIDVFFSLITRPDVPLRGVNSVRSHRSTGKFSRGDDFHIRLLRCIDQLPGETYPSGFRLDLRRYDASPVAAAGPPLDSSMPVLLTSAVETFSNASGSDASFDWASQMNPRCSS